MLEKPLEYYDENDSRKSWQKVANESVLDKLRPGQDADVGMEVYNHRYVLLRMLITSMSVLQIAAISSLNVFIIDQGLVLPNCVRAKYHSISQLEILSRTLLTKIKN